MGRTDSFVTISGSMARRQLRATYGLDAARIACIGGGVDGEAIRAVRIGGAHCAHAGSIAPDAPVAGIVSRLRPARGHLWLLDAAARVLPARPAARLVICGRGSWKDELAAHVARHPARDQIVLAGYVTGTDLEDSYNAFDVALLLKPGNDGACRAALEAMACGRPLIGGDLGALHDLLAGTEAGWLVPPDDVEALAVALGQALDDPTGCRTRGARARQHIERHFTEEAMTAQLLAFYAALPGAHDSGKHASPR
ncbi:MAG: glycosyltransferase family 4 protein [Candidatus Sumerlaeia bacterium]|nr:glycosyltransferase family 4 protein [Candidatus Sumerlaeia bacterium]